MKMDSYQQYIHKSRYSRWLEDLKRRETWPETVQRYINFFDEQFERKHTDLLNGRIKEAILNLDVMPSMRVLMSAGPALAREHLAGFNCSYLAANNKEAFSEALYILMCGTGVGFSCERQEINQLPEVPSILMSNEDSIVVGDSKRGWAEAYATFIDYLYAGELRKVDYSQVRAAGERLKIFGGRASGPAPLQKLFKFTKEVFMAAQGRKLESLEVHDLMCMIGEIVVVGGVRRSALISLSNLSDQRMRDAKVGAWYDTNAQRGLANNSVAYTEKPKSDIFMDEWLSLMRSGSGERGIFNRQAAGKQAAKWGRRDPDLNYGCNPCSEIILRDKQLCNLSEVIVRADDTINTLMEKVEIATILGTFQSSLTDFGFVSDKWKENTAEECLLGVSLTGIMDNKMMSAVGTGSTTDINTLKMNLNQMRQHARNINDSWAETLGINKSTAITCVKPSGTVSQLCDTASGIHTRHNEHYIRTVRVDKKDPLYQFMIDQGLPTEDEAYRPNNTAVVSFPIKAPEGAITRRNQTALEALELWLLYQREWCEHKPSVTITVKEEEWPAVGAWVYDHFDEVSGISFLPHVDHTYIQAPYQDLTPEEYKAWIIEHPIPVIDWDELSKYEAEDNTTSSQELACSAGGCDIL